MELSARQPLGSAVPVLNATANKYFNLQHSIIRIERGESGAEMQICNLLDTSVVCCNMHRLGSLRVSTTTHIAALQRKHCPRQHLCCPARQTYQKALVPHPGWELCCVHSRSVPASSTPTSPWPGMNYCMSHQRSCTAHLLNLPWYIQTIHSDEHLTGIP